MVCALAGLEPDHIHPQFLKLIETFTGGQKKPKTQMRFAAE
jgi:hypothetical protein